jgi:hypothetical protein
MNIEEKSCALCMRTNCPLRNASEAAVDDLSFLEIIVRFLKTLQFL